MLARSAGRRERRHTARLLAASFAQLNLPWLAPAQVRWTASHAAAISHSPQHIRRRRMSRTKSLSTQCRNLATATEQYTPRHSSQYPPPGYSSTFRNSNQDKNIPWDIVQKSEGRISDLRPYEDPIVINTSIHNPAQTIKVSHGIQGTAVDLLQHLHTALQVGRLSRAESIIKRLADICPSSSAEMVHAHTAYLEESLKSLAFHGRGEQAQQKLQSMQKWFEVEVRGKSVFVDAKMLVVMIRGTIKALSGPQRDRTVRRYADMARQVDDEYFYDVLEAEDYDDNEFTILGRVAYDENKAMSAPQPQTVAHELASTDVYHERREFLPLEKVPDVLETEQQGEGLTSVKRALEDFTTSPTLPADAPADRRTTQALKRQEALEKNSVEIAVGRWKRSDEELRRIGIHTSMQSKPMGAMMWQWYCALLPALQAELSAYKKLISNSMGRDHDRYHYGPYLELLPLEKVAANTILFTMSKLASGKNRETRTYEAEIKISSITTGLAKAIEQECRVEAESKKLLSRKKLMKGAGLTSNDRHAQPQKRGKRLSKGERERQSMLAQLEWPTDAKVKLGAILISKLMETAQLPVTRQHPRTKEKITQMQPALLHRWKYQQGKKVGILSPNRALTDKLETEPVGSLIAKRMPMVVEPKPWTSWNEGGYLYYSNPILRMPPGDKSPKSYFLAAHKKGHTKQLYAGLTALGEVPWKIHHGVFKVQLEAWNSGEEVANFAPLHPKLEAPPEPEASSNPEPRRRWLAEVREIENKRAGLHSKRCFQNFQLEVSRSMVNETLYFPHSMDFRGRAYPIPPYLNHMGADNVRGLLVFANGKELGPHGLRWLKIHLATVAGHDKASMSERVEFTEKHLDDIYDSVRNPLDGRRWWLEAEDAWQTLAACFELTEALDSPDPAKYVSHLPIQQDGTCNGLQHYAALGGDKIGAAQVNLEPGDRPADVYTAVAEAVKEEVRQDAAKGNPIALKLDGNLTRKCVKQPVMTNVYGVTWFGAREQVKKQLEDIFPDVRKYDTVNYGNMSHYIANKIFKCLGSMFTGAQAIQTWLGQCADRISTSLTPEQIAKLTSDVPDDGAKKKKKRAKPGSEQLQIQREADVGRQLGTAVMDNAQQRAAKPLFKSTVVWTTPLRLPVVQPYRSEGSRVITTSIQQISLQEPQVWHPVSKRKQLQAFPPNFIHSLDATHMFLSALRCKELGMTFASIHDSFWTHACDVDKLSKVLRDAFIEMHSDNIVGRLREEFQTRYEGCMYLASVLAQSPVGKKISELRRHKKKDGSSELAAESQRLQLLASENPEERAKGEAMTTPGSIMANEGSETELYMPTEISSHQLGTIPDNEVEPTNSDADETSWVAQSAEPAEEAEEDADAETMLPTSSTEEAKAQFQQHLGSSEKAKKKVYPRKIFVWMPLTFPEVPPKGEFDVRRIRDSNYFFH